ncbi:MAG: hypothetical protein ABIP20_13295 [Chthoniobacteraceae bacterium]
MYLAKEQPRVQDAFIAEEGLNVMSRLTPLSWGVRPEPDIRIIRDAPHPEVRAIGRRRKVSATRTAATGASTRAAKNVRVCFLVIDRIFIIEVSP